MDTEERIYQRVDRGFEESNARMRDGFEAINRRLDLQNGRVGTAERAIERMQGEYGTRFEHLEEELRERRSGAERRLEPPAVHGPYTKQQISAATVFVVLLAWVGDLGLFLVKEGSVKVWAAVIAVLKGTQ